MKTLMLVVTLCVGVLLGATPAVANKRAQAMARFEKGEKLYEEGEYEDALRAFQTAYKLEPIPLLFVNIAQCHRQLGNHEAAIAAFERYLEAEPDAPNRSEIEDILITERSILEPAAPPDPIPELEPEVAPEPTPVATPTVAAAAPPAKVEDDGGNAGLWLAVGGGTLFAVVGGAIIAAIALQPAPAQPTGSLGTFDLR